MRSGLHIWATSSTQRPNRSCLGFSAAVSTSIVVVAIMMNISPVDRCADHGRVAEYGRLIHGGFAPYNTFLIPATTLLFSLSCGHYSSEPRLVMAWPGNFRFQ